MSSPLHNLLQLVDSVKMYTTVNDVHYIEIIFLNPKYPDTVFSFSDTTIENAINRALTKVRRVLNA